MGTVTTANKGQRLIPEAELTATFLPGCGGCGAPHPRSPAGGNLDTNTCPRCGTTVPVGRTVFSPASLAIQWWMWPFLIVAVPLLLIGKALFALSRRI